MRVALAAVASPLRPFIHHRTLPEPTRPPASSVPPRMKPPHFVLVIGPPLINQGASYFQGFSGSVAW